MTAPRCASSVSSRFATKSSRVGRVAPTAPATIAARIATALDCARRTGARQALAHVVHGSVRTARVLRRRALYARATERRVARRVAQRPAAAFACVVARAWLAFVRRVALRLGVVALAVARTLHAVTAMRPSSRHAVRRGRALAARSLTRACAAPPIGAALRLVRASAWLGCRPSRGRDDRGR